MKRIRWRGREAATGIRERVGLEGEVKKRVLDELKLWHQTIRLYRSRQWDQVEVNLLNLHRMNPGCALYELYAKEAAGERRTPPPAELGGETVFDEKKRTGAAIKVRMPG